MSSIDKLALRMRNYLDTAFKSGVKLLHLSTDELKGLLDELEAAEQELKNWRTSFDNERFRADKLAAALSDEHEQRVMASRALITQHTRANEAEKRIAELEARTFNPAILDVIAERQRQQSVKGFSTQQDDTYIGGELAAAAISYIEPMEAGDYWPADWHDDSFRPSDYRRNLVKAGALLIAEIERIDRATDIGDGELAWVK
ncbi:TPA: hypothetical protein ACGQTY_002507 [Citrobacter farmeri]|uniref:Ead/Ea22-like family protein n=1 Tax=Citrobacter amalonaticus TaxID=35703 RepID=A0AAX2BE84_CITAM|nr:hypothetical protein [Citrobacter amalonaticus]SAZ04655.1 conserved protein of unknown function [Citrobacter amalonaticus]